MVRDYIQEVRKIIKALDRESQQKIEEAIASGATGTEIAMGIRFHLFNLLKNPSELDSNIKTEAQSILDYLNGLLK
jgi:hypothetical protein